MQNNAQRYILGPQSPFGTNSQDPAGRRIFLALHCHPDHDFPEIRAVKKTASISCHSHIPVFMQVAWCTRGRLSLSSDLPSPLSLNGSAEFYHPEKSNLFPRSPHVHRAKKCVPPSAAFLFLWNAFTTFFTFMFAKAATFYAVVCPILNLNLAPTI